MGSTRHPEYFPDELDDLRAARGKMISAGVVACERVVRGEIANEELDLDYNTARSQLRNSESALGRLLVTASEYI